MLYSYNKENHKRTYIYSIYWGGIYIYVDLCNSNTYCSRVNCSLSVSKVLFPPYLDQ